MSAETSADVVHWLIGYICPFLFMISFRRFANPLYFTF